MNIDREILWEELLGLVGRGVVVPVVGQDLLAVDVGARAPVLLYDHLAARVAARLQLPLPAKEDCSALHAVACAHLARQQDLEPFYDALRDEVREAAGLPIPRPLRALAAITDFPLFVSTTFDSFLGRALDEVRFGSKSKTEILRFSPYGYDDLPPGSATAAKPVVYHLFGLMSNLREYAVTDGDMLEIVHKLQTDSERPPRLFETLDRRVLLLIGNSFSDWLARFFIRTTKRERLVWTAADRKKEYVADRSVDGGLGTFLQLFSRSTRVLDTDPIGFVTELHERWTARRQPSTSRAELPPMHAGSVFVSYAREDARAADELAQLLRAANLDVWLDCIDLVPGDAWEPKLLLNIRDASSFVTIVSRHSLTPEDRFFRTEWTFAAKIQERLPASRRFIFPIVLDDTPKDHQDIPAALRERHWTPFAELTPGHVLLELLAENVKAFQTRKRAS